MGRGESRSLAGGAVLRRASPGDEDGILDCVRGLAEYENEPDAVQTTAQDLRQGPRLSRWCMKWPPRNLFLFKRELPLLSIQSH